MPKCDECDLTFETDDELFDHFYAVVEDYEEED